MLFVPEHFPPNACSLHYVNLTKNVDYFQSISQTLAPRAADLHILFVSEHFANACSLKYEQQQSNLGIKDTEIKGTPPRSRTKQALQAQVVP